MPKKGCKEFSLDLKLLNFIHPKLSLVTKYLEKFGVQTKIFAIIILIISLIKIIDIYGKKYYLINRALYHRVLHNRILCD